MIVFLPLGVALIAAAFYLKTLEVEPSVFRAPKIVKILAPPSTVSLVAGQKRKNPKDGLVYVWIPAGRFIMGCSPGDSDCNPDEKPAHEVTLTHGFWLGQTEVTEAAYSRFSKTSSGASTDPKLPVVNVSWEDARRYCGEWARMRLPTEAEWEYAARAGTTGSRYGDLKIVAWYIGNSPGRHQQIGLKLPNAWGVYDMLGNVWEWVADWHGDYQQKAGTDPTGPSKGSGRVARGGSWADDPRYARVSFRGSDEPQVRFDRLGFRCAGELP